MSDSQTIADLLEVISRDGRVPIELWPASLFLQPADLGLIQTNDFYHWQDLPDVVDAPRLQLALPDLDTAVFPLVDSTNTRLLEEGANLSIANRLYVAEFQYGGRGRRGRQWLSPYGRNLAMSLAVNTSRQLIELGGLSIVVGVALASALEGVGVQDLQLKWPNDVLVGDEKLCGILVELAQRKSSVDVVVGMGVNVSLTKQERHQIGQPVTDLRRCGVTHDRTDLVIRCIRNLQTCLQHFEAEGFSPFVSAFNALHKFHGQTCSILQGEHTVSGHVIGIGEQGELILQTSNGEQRFHGGEVSLRPAH